VSVNEGMALHGDRDVVLLNSDTEVAAGWLDRLAAMRAARCRDRHDHAVLHQRDHLQLSAQPRPERDAGR
jgi:hypothetical protein